MTTTVSARLEKSELALLDELGELSGFDRSTLIKSLLRQGMKEMRLEQASAAYRRKEVSLGRAAELAGLAQWEFVAQMKDLQLDLHYDVAELEEDLAS